MALDRMEICERNGSKVAFRSNAVELELAEDWGIEPFAVETIVADYKPAARTF
jgi:hypothetical protein